MTGLILLCVATFETLPRGSREGIDRSEVARCFTRKIFLPRTVSGGKNYAPVTLLERNAAMTRCLIILTLSTCEFLVPCPSELVRGKTSLFFICSNFLPVPEM